MKIKLIKSLSLKKNCSGKSLLETDKLTDSLRMLSTKYVNLLIPVELTKL